MSCKILPLIVCTRDIHDPGHFNDSLLGPSYTSHDINIKLKNSVDFWQMLGEGK